LGCGSSFGGSDLVRGELYGVIEFYVLQVLDDIINLGEFFFYLSRYIYHLYNLAVTSIYCFSTASLLQVIFPVLSRYLML